MKQRIVTNKKASEPEELEHIHKLKFAGEHIYNIAKDEKACLLKRKWIPFELTEFEAAFPVLQKTTHSKVELI